MSPSNLPSGPYRLDVFAAPGTEISVQDGRFRVVENGRGVGRWSGELHAGFYKVRLRIGQTHLEEHVVLDKPVTKDFRTTPVRFSSAALLNDSTKTHEYQTAAAQAQSRMIHHKAGQGAQVFVMVREWTRSGTSRVRLSNPALGLNLVSRGVPLCDIESKAKSESNSGQDPWAACNVEVDPGEYQLRLELPNRSLSMAVVAPAGWQTLVFLMLHNYSMGKEEEKLRRADLNEASILMCKPGTFDPYREDLRLGEVARLSLANNRRRIVSEEVRDRLLEAKFENPMFGLFGAYLYLLGEAKRTKTSALSSVLGTAATASATQLPVQEFLPIISNLRQLVGPHHPDVEALAESTGFQTSHTFKAPPMLRASWSAVLRATAQRPTLVPQGSTADQAADRIFGYGPWLVWESENREDPAAIETDSSVESAALSRFLESPAVAATTEESKMPAAVTALGLPRARVESLMADVSRDRERLATLASQEVVDAFRSAASPSKQSISVDGRLVEIPVPFPSPPDWRDHWIYFLMIDRFHNPAASPRHSPWDGIFNGYQGGTFEGVRQKLPYLQNLGVGAIWLSPVLKNRSSDVFSFHGYGIQNFLRIEPRFASSPGREEAELRALVDEAHARGMYVILDVVLNHAGDVFEYEGHGGSAPWSDQPRPVRWRDSDGQGRRDWQAVEAISEPLVDAVVWPAEFQRNALFRRQGKGGEAGGDFESLKELVTGYREADGRFPIRDALIRACQYMIARFDVDGFRIDTLKYIERDFAQTFGNAVREYALSIGKKNFFTFGEVYDNEEQIARFIGRNTSDEGDMVGVDAALDFPLFYHLPGVVKGLAAPSDVIGVFRHRKVVERHVLSSHGDASRYFVTFLDNHDQHARFRYAPSIAPAPFDAQVPLGVGLLMSLQGIPCLYYGTEQGLCGAGHSDANVREALWGRPLAFDPSHVDYKAIAALSRLRTDQPALRYGRQYFRPISGDGRLFGVSNTSPGVLTFSRILNDQEVVVVANTQAHDSWTGFVIVDNYLNRSMKMAVLYGTPPGLIPVQELFGTEVHEVDGEIHHGDLRAIRVTVKPMGLLILGSSR